MPLLVRGRPVTVSIDRVKPTYILNGPDRGNYFFPPVDLTPAIAQPATRTTRSGRHIHFPVRFNIRATISTWAGGGGDVGTTHKSNRELLQGSRSCQYLYFTAFNLLSGYPHKRYPMSAHNCSSTTNWSALRLAASA
jgi:hypothetical protein